jgi:hypothetical protein
MGRLDNVPHRIIILDSRLMSNDNAGRFANGYISTGMLVHSSNATSCSSINILLQPYTLR